MTDRRTDLVLLHGWGMRRTVFAGLAGDLACHARMHALDLPGYGDERYDGSYALADLALRIADLAPPRCAVLGWSLGGLIAMEWARARPRQVTKLVLTATTPCFVERAQWPHGLAREALSGFEEAVRSDASLALRRFIALQARGDERERAVVSALRAALGEQAPPLPVLQAGLAVLRESDLRGYLRAIDQPTLVVHGERDVVTPPGVGSFLAHMLPQARLAMIEGAAHAPFLSQPARVAELVAEHLDG